MILWTVKLLSSVRRAIAGRRYPHQLAWAVAFGILLGIVPHGNLLAIFLLLVVLSLKINHAMAGLTAVGATFVATHLDPFSHNVGNYVLTHPQLGETAANAWQLPLVPWTDLNNTVVMGSFLIGVGALVPVFMVTYPVFRALAPKDDELENASWSGADSVPADVRQGDHQVVLIDRGHTSFSGPHRGSHPSTETPDTNSISTNSISTNSISANSIAADSISTNAPDGPAATAMPVEFVEIEPGDDPQVAVETRIDVIRMKDHDDDGCPSNPNDEPTQQEPMDEALNYLLRQLRDSQQRNAA